MDGFADAMRVVGRRVSLLHAVVVKFEVPASTIWLWVDGVVQPCEWMQRQVVEFVLTLPVEQHADST